VLYKIAKFHYFRQPHTTIKKTNMKNYKLTLFTTLLLLLSNLCFATIADDYLALRSFYLSTNGDSWTDNSNWPDAATFNANPTMPMGTTFSGWYGITTNAQGRVKNMNFFGNNISGTLPNNLDLLSEVEVFELSDNAISGNIPIEIGYMPSLVYLFLNNNQFSGNIPAELGNLINLIQLQLSVNQLTGPIPPELGKLVNVSNLSLFGTQISGSIPPELGNMTSLSSLSLRQNQLTGVIPVELGQLSNLNTLQVNDNQLVGNIPGVLGNLPLTQLRVNNNNLSGCYDSNLSNLCSVIVINNSVISSGNNFNVDWSTFCSTGMGTCAVATCTATPAANKQIHVENGDVYIEEMCHGIVFKSADGNCHRLLVESGGSLKVEPVTCP